ncbi:sensor histidine kinase [Ancylomarina longa]|uniref:histidine kinase n=1 Tax=Ancylomarina longa TaxID=2487017 RepID=A0A434AEV0_9BACT|nr:HAMP domain-containing sensor histidine kinase [Ancylomarina longa]RUT72855.1 sensor histidine kinase [Ancylomarina longa]
MTKKLIHKTSRAYLLFSVIVVLIIAPVFYFVTEQLYIEDADEALTLRKKEFLHYNRPHFKSSDINVWNKFNRDIKIIANTGTSRDSFFYNHYYDTLDAEEETYRELNTPVVIEGKKYTFLARTNLVETEDLIVSIAVLFIALLIVLLLGLFFISKILSLKLWKPFYKTLAQIEAFEIDKNNSFDFSDSKIEEFNRLNQSIKKLITKNISIYRSQREFIENAAHELQTPLAVFQAKIDLLYQHTELNKEQLEIINALNDSVRRIKRLNKNLLLLSKIDNKVFASKQKVSIQKQFEKLLDFYSEQAQSMHIGIEINLQEDILVDTNSDLLDILLNNLFQNAIRHNREGGKINIQLADNSLSFSNTGEPIALDVDKLFRRFSKSSSSSRGNGLGLAIIQKIAESNNWKIAYTYEHNYHCFKLTF